MEKEKIKFINWVPVDHLYKIKPESTKSLLFILRKYVFEKEIKLPFLV